MAVIKCKMCGGNIELSTDKTFGVCECCGSTMTFPKVDDDQRAAAFNRGNYFRRIGEFDKALTVYERIVEEDNADAEAHWCCALCRYGIEYVEDPTSHEYLPTCHRASFDNFLEDVDYQAALQYSDGVTKRQYKKDAAKIAEVQHGILATCQTEQPFDVFICYKESDENGNRTKDSALAQEIYYQLTDQGRRVFFARITLEDKIGTEYEPYIFAALNSAKVMIVVGTKPEYFNAVWVKNEWSRFLAMMKKDHSKLLLPCYRDMDPYDLPEALAVLQSYDISKIGFIQDLIRGISKVLDIGNQLTSETKETDIVHNITNTNVTAQIKRGDMALVDHEWAQAKVFYNKALDIDAECAEAYLGLALADAECINLEMLQKKQINEILSSKQEITVAVPFQGEMQDELNRTIRKYSDEVEKLCNLPQIQTNIKDLFRYTDFQIQSCVKSQQEKWKDIQQFYTNNREISKALRFAKGETNKMLKGYLSGLNSAVEQLLTEQMRSEDKSANEIRKHFDDFMKNAKATADKLIADTHTKLESDYLSAREKQSIAKSSEEWRKAAELYEILGNYKDAKELHTKCENVAKELEVKKQRKRMRIVGVITLVGSVLLASYATVVLVVIPMSKYRKAEGFYNAGNYDEAQAIFAELSNYKDAEYRAEECKNLRLQEKYGIAQAFLDSKDYDSAERAFSELGSYSDAPEKAIQAEYEKIVEEIPKAENYSELKPQIRKVLEEKGLNEEAISINPYYAYCCAREALQQKNYVLAYNQFKQCASDSFLDSVEQATKVEELLDPQYEEAEVLLTNDDVKYSEVREAFSNLAGYKDTDYYLFYIMQCENLAKDDDAQSIAFAFKNSRTFVIITLSYNLDKWVYCEAIDGHINDAKVISKSDMTQELQAFVNINEVPTQKYVDRIYDSKRETYKARM